MDTGRHPSSSLLALVTITANECICSSHTLSSHTVSHTRSLSCPPGCPHQSHTTKPRIQPCWEPAPPTSILNSHTLVGLTTRHARGLPHPRAHPEQPHKAGPHRQPSLGPVLTTSVLAALGPTKKERCTQPTEGTVLEKLALVARGEYANRHHISLQKATSPRSGDITNLPNT